MGKLANLQKSLDKFDQDTIIKKTLEENRDFINDLIRDRLNKTGKDATGKKLKTKKAKSPNVYTPFTIAVKKSKGQPTNRVTLKDTGEFQKSFEAQIRKDFFNIKGDSKKPDGEIEDNVDLTNVLRLSDEEITELKNEILENVQSKTRKAIKI